MVMPTVETVQTLYQTQDVKNTKANNLDVTPVVDIESHGENSSRMKIQGVNTDVNDVSQGTTPKNGLLFEQEHEHNLTVDIINTKSPN